jgi:hypothetical protein
MFARMFLFSHFHLPYLSALSTSFAMPLAMDIYLVYLSYHYALGLRGLFIWSMSYLLAFSDSGRKGLEWTLLLDFFLGRCIPLLITSFDRPHGEYIPPYCLNSLVP